MNDFKPDVDDEEEDLTDEELGSTLIHLLLLNELPPALGPLLEAGLQQAGVAGVQIREEFADAEQGMLHAEIWFDGHLIRVIGFDAPVPEEVVKNAIDCAHWKKEDKAPMRTHRTHIVCQYLEGEAYPNQQMLAMNKVAGCFLAHGLIGCVDPDAWNCVPAHVLQEMLTEQNQITFAEHPPLIVWAGFVKFFTDNDHIWFCSKGFHRWGVPDFAWLGPMSEAEQAWELFQALFHYVLDNDVNLNVGDTAQFGDNLILRFAAVTDYEEYLNGPLGTLVIERLNPSQFH